MSMKGIGDVLLPMAQLVQSGLQLANPATVLAETRICGFDDPTYGTVQWVPRLDGKPFALIEYKGTTDDDKSEPNRTRVHALICIFVALADATTPYVAESFNYLAALWGDAARQFVAGNRMLGQYDTTLQDAAGDVRWSYRGSIVRPEKKIYEDMWYGVEINTEVILRVATIFQYR